jgi:hypothetical protein
LRARLVLLALRVLWVLPALLAPTALTEHRVLPALLDPRVRPASLVSLVSLAPPASVIARINR